MTFADILHGFFNFLGLVEGELFKATIELIFFSIIAYMVISEWTRNKRKELKILMIAFCALILDKLIVVFFLASYIFTDTAISLWKLSVSHNFFEIFALFLVVNAFVYPILRQKRLSAKLFILKRLVYLILASFVLSLVLLSIIDLKKGYLELFWLNTSINVAEIIVLLYYAAFIVLNDKYKLSYRNNIVFAFIVYSIAPIIELVNIFFYDNVNRSLIVASHPFPFLSILIFTQVIYLKLADKATLQEMLKQSESRYVREREISKLKDEFVSTVSHELKTPLTSMKLYVGLLKDGKLGSIKKKQKDALGIVNSETDRLNNLITDLLDLSRLESGKVKLDLSEFDLNDVVSDVLYVNMAKNSGITVVCSVPKHFIVTADRDKLKQVFINLFNNAVKFTSKGGRITISAKSTDEEWSFSVNDTGRGIDKASVPRLFDKFYQAENFMTRTKGGFGLGLSIVKSIVELHKGRIDVQSEPGKGTKFTIYFPKLSRY